MARDRGDRNRGCDADENQQRRHQETAAYAEHAGDETNRRAHRQDEEDIDRNVGDRKVELHARLLFAIVPLTEPKPLTAWVSVSSPAVESGWRRGQPARAGCLPLA